VLGLTTVAYFTTGSRFPAVIFPEAFGMPAQGRTCVEVPSAPKMSAAETP
jgi:hypothetical protein